MMSRDVLLAEVGAAVAILGLLLVFLPLFLRAAERAAGGEESEDERRSRERRAYVVAGTVVGAALVVTLGLLALWLRSDVLATLTGIGLLIVTWCVVLLAGMAVWTSIR
jgi:hypothetical protein